MKLKKVLNLYAGVGGNRKLWQEVKVTAVEKDPLIAGIYKSLYPNDEVIIADAHLFLSENFGDFDFIWSSPPCQSHSSMRQNLAVRYRGVAAKYPDLSLYQEIIFLSYNFRGLWVVENVKPYYEPLIAPSFELHRHLFWSNFNVPYIEFASSRLRSAQIPDLQEHLGIYLDNFKIPNKRQILRNCVYPPVGLHIYESAIKPTKNKITTLPLFENYEVNP